MILHIVRKDLREQWLMIALATIAILANAILSDWIVGGHNAPIELLAWALWALVVARLVHSEPVPGERQYWLTRPIPRISLLGAKVLGTLLFLHLPHLIGDIITLASAGFNPMEHLAGLLWKQTLAFASWTLPLLVLAVITRTLAQFVLSLLAILVVLTVSANLTWKYDFHWMGIHWMKGLFERFTALAAGVALLWLQYFKRRTATSRILAAASIGAICLIAFFSPWGVAYAIQQRINPSRIAGTTIQGAFDPTGTLPLDAPYYRPLGDEVNIILPLTWRGLPEGANIIPDRTVASIRLQNGEVLRPKPRSNFDYFRDSGMKWAILSIHKALLAKVETQKVDLDLTMFITVYGRGRTYRIPANVAEAQTVPEVGRCFPDRREQSRLMLHCRAALKNTGLIMARLTDTQPGDDLTWQRLNFQPSYTPLPTELSLGNPLTSSSILLERSSVNSNAHVEFLVREVIGHIAVDMKVPGVKLADFTVKR
jgi:hypothetical protein